MRLLTTAQRRQRFLVVGTLMAGLTGIAVLPIRGSNVAEGRLLLRIPEDHEPSAVAYTGSGRIQGFEQGWFPAWNADGTAAAYIARKEGSAFVVSGRWTGPRLNTIVPPLLVSPDGNRVVYQGSVRTEWGQGWVIVVNDRISSSPFLVPLSLAISPDGSRVAYAAPSGDPLVAVGDRRAGAFEAAKGPVVFSADGSRVAAVVQLDGQWRVCIGDSKAPRAAVSGMQFAFNEMMGPLGDAGAYRWFLEPDTKQPGYEDLSTPAFSADGRTVAYAARRNGKWLVSAASTSLQFDEIGAIAVRQDGAEVSYAAREGASDWFLVRGSQKSGPYENVGELTYSPSGARLAVATKRNGRWSMSTAPGLEQRLQFDAVVGATFSPDERTLAYVATNGKQNLLVIGSERSPAADRIERPRFTPDGSAVTYGSLEGREVWARVFRIGNQQAMRHKN